MCLIQPVRNLFRTFGTPVPCTLRLPRRTRRDSAGRCDRSSCRRRRRRKRSGIRGKRSAALPLYRKRNVCTNDGLVVTYQTCPTLGKASAGKLISLAPRRFVCGGDALLVKVGTGVKSEEGRKDDNHWWWLVWAPRISSQPLSRNLVLSTHILYSYNTHSHQSRRTSQP